MSTARKTAHDALVEGLPPGVVHSCMECSPVIEAAEGERQVDTITEADVQRRIQEALAAAETDAKVQGERDAAVAERDAAVAELEATKVALDAAKQEAAAAAAERDAAKGETAAAEARAAAAEQSIADIEAARIAEEAKAARVAEVKALNLFDEKEIEAQADAWSSHSPEVWASLVDGFKTAAAKAGPPRPARSGLGVEATASAASGASTSVTAGSIITRAVAAGHK